MEKEKPRFHDRRSELLMLLTILALAGLICYLFWMGLLAEAARLTNHDY